MTLQLCLGKWTVKKPMADRGFLQRAREERDNETMLYADGGHCAKCKGSYDWHMSLCAPVLLHMIQAHLDDPNNYPTMRTHAVWRRTRRTRTTCACIGTASSR